MSRRVVDRSSSELRLRQSADARLSGLELLRDQEPTLVPCPSGLLT